MSTVMDPLPDLKLLVMWVGIETNTKIHAKHKKSGRYLGQYDWILNIRSCVKITDKKTCF